MATWFLLLAVCHLAFCDNNTTSTQVDSNSFGGRNSTLNNDDDVVPTRQSIIASTQFSPTRSVSHLSTIATGPPDRRFIYMGVGGGAVLLLLLLVAVLIVYRKKAKKNIRKRTAATALERNGSYREPLYPEENSKELVSPKISKVQLRKSYEKLDAVDNIDYDGEVVGAMRSRSIPCLDTNDPDDPSYSYRPVSHLFQNT